MKKFSIIVFAALFIGVVLSAQENKDRKGSHKKSHVMTGYLVDQSCGKRMVMDDIKKSDAKAAKHTKECALEETCAASGYGIVTGGKFYPFDNAGNKKAANYLNATKKENNMKVEVAGMMDGDKIQVESIKDFKPTGKKK
jgi:hypothetical protein